MPIRYLRPLVRHLSSGLCRRVWEYITVICNTSVLLSNWVVGHGRDCRKTRGRRTALRHVSGSEKWDEESANLREGDLNYHCRWEENRSGGTRGAHGDIR